VSVRYTLALTPADVGSRVVVRHRHLEGGLTDALGQLEAWQGGVLTIRRRDGSVVDVAWNDVVAAKVVPTTPRREKTTSPEELQGIAARGWGTAENEWLGRWWLRAAHGFTGRANAVIPLGEPGIAIDEALAHVTRWYTDRGLPPMVQCIVDSELDTELARQGWTALAEALLQVGDITAARAALGDGNAASLHKGGTPTDAWIRRYRADAPTEAARIVLGGGPDRPETALATIGDDDNPVAVGRAVVEGPWLGIAAVSVDEAHRRHGHAKAVMRALLDFGTQHGARRAYLQVWPSNEAALNLYAALGFTTHHRYHYRSPGTEQPHPTSDR
jgi:GNAT superfamily N-acetyltransferase